MKTDNQRYNESVEPNTAFLNELKSKLPEFFSKDGEFDLDKFQRELKDKNIAELRDGYQLNFIGKDYARRQAGEMPSTVIVPDMEQNEGEGKDSKNLFFTGDNLEVLRHLRNNYANKIDVIYIDPPYNTGSDGFAYPDNFEYSDEKLQDMFGLNDDEIKRLKNIQGKSSHSAWLTFMYPRLVLAKQLLSNTGVLFMSIDDNEQATIKLLMDEIFGEVNLIAQLAVQMSKTQGMKVGSAQKGNIVKNKEFVLVYGKNVNEEVNRIPLYDHVNQYDTHYSYFLYENGTLGNLMDVLKSELTLVDDITELSKIRPLSIKTLGFYMEHSEKVRDFIFENSDVILRDNNADINIPLNVQQVIKKNGKIKPYVYKIDSNSKPYLLISVGSGTIRQLLPLSETYHNSDDFKSKYGRSTIRGDWWPDFNLDMMNISKEDDVEYKNGKKPVRLIKQLIKWAGVSDGIILDFFAGSATTASAVMQNNHELGTNNKFILVQLPENLDERLQNANSKAKKDIKSIIKMLDGVEKPHYIDELSQLRIRKASKFINDDKVDSSFKHYRVVEPTQPTLDSIEDFNIDNPDLFNDVLSGFASDKLGVAGQTTGEQTILTTWLAKDGYSFDVDRELIDLDGYQGTLVDDSRLYLINAGWTSDCTKHLLNLLGTYQLSIQTIVLFGYSFNLDDLKELEVGLRQLDNKVNVVTRY